MSYKDHFLLPIPNDIDPKIKAYLKSLHGRLGSEFRAIQSQSATTSSTITIATGGGGGSGGGGGGTGTKLALVVTQSVVAGTFTISFAPLPNAGYGVISILQNANGDFSFATPQVPPLTDTRSLSQVDAIAQESGTAYTFIILP